MLAWALFSVARKGAVCYCSISELTGLKGQFDAIAATLMGFLEKISSRKERISPYS